LIEYETLFSFFSEDFVDESKTIFLVISSAADPDPRSGAFLPPGSGMNFFTLLLKLAPEPVKSKEKGILL
jgi:hypothetical protein